VISFFLNWFGSLGHRMLGLLTYILTCSMERSFLRI
jgi:hypothetical protein